MADLGKLLARAAPILARVAVDRPAKLVEIGVFAGDLAAHLLALRPLLVYHGVDNWLPREEQPLAYRATCDSHANAAADDVERWRRCAFERLATFASRATIHEAASPAAATMFPDAIFDLVFCDARHDHEGCLADLRAWWPKVRPGGWLGSHDFGNPDPRFCFGVDQAVADFAAEVGLTHEPDGGCTVWFRKPS